MVEFMNNGFEGIWKEVILADFRSLYTHLSGATEFKKKKKNFHENSWPLS
jgi:hypothetical protein